jgi:ABC-type antimicrobial peptide transport system permease subunit
LLGPSLRSLLFGVTPLDPLTYVVAGGALLCVGALAASVPARRAARIDPVEALRQE